MADLSDITPPTDGPEVNATVAHATPRVGRRDDDWWRGAVIYQIYPRSFADTNEDGVGDLAGILDRLDHIARLNVDAIWLSPFFKSPMADYGYDVSDYCDVDPLFGSLRDFDALVAKAHRLDLKVLIDFVPSHTSRLHPWFQESSASTDNAKADWYVWADPKPDGTPPTNWLAQFGGSAWTWEARRQQYYLHNFLPDQPDLNFYNPEVIEALLGQARFWLERGVDGFRIDAIDFGVHDRHLRDNPPRSLEDRRARVSQGLTPVERQYLRHNKARPELSDLFLKPMFRMSEIFPSRALLGEISGDFALERIAQYTSGGGLDMAYSFDLLTCAPHAAAVRAEIARMESSLDDQGWVCWSLSNHDVPRAVSRFGGEQPAEELRLLLPVMLCSLRGSICLYQGEELGLSEADLTFEDLHDPWGISFYPMFKGRDGSRTPMPWLANALHGGFSPTRPWLPVPASHAARAVDVQEHDGHSILCRLRAFLAWRRQQRALIRGSLRLLDAPDAVLAFVRQDGEQTLFCAFNLSDAAQEFTAPATAAADCPVATGAIKDGRVQLPAYGTYFGFMDTKGQQDG